MQHISLTNPIYDGQNTTATLPAFTPESIILLLNGQTLTLGAGYQRSGSVLTIDGDVTGEQLDVIVLDTPAPISLTADYLLLQLLLAIKNMACNASNTSSSSSSSSASTTITTTGTEIDPLADLKTRLSALQTQSMSNVITTDRQLADVNT